MRNKIMIIKEQTINNKRKMNKNNKVRNKIKLMMISAFRITILVLKKKKNNNDL